MKATIKDFFGSNLEQEVLDEVVLLPEGVYAVGTYNLAFDLSDFEFLLASGVISTDANMNNAIRVTSEIDVASLKQRAWLVGERTQTAGSGTGEITLSYLGERSVYVGLVSTGSAMLARFTKLVGYKRRISRVGIDELMSAMSLPNLCANADLTDNPINQRAFNGNWSTLTTGAYGYDQWMKVSSTRMGYVIEAGKYRPNTKHTVTRDDVVIGEFTSPASGHFAVALPFATTGKFDIYAGQFKRPWHPVQDGFDRCLEHYEVGESTYVNNSTTANRAHYYQVRFTKRKRKVPSVLRTGNGSVNADSARTAFALPTNFGFYMNKATSANAPYALGGSWQADASITLAELNNQIINII
ncbi:hypothetical protein AVV29_gp088 [Vibrio phage phi 3]|uniref:Uncharacterized protein n=1 Tax=Vibrio phage phi 3 TaxID=1589298 RepID=A0A0B5HEB6_9CAUD|nr:hypothetical protein AVV29_gp088 [Vibrio phage phi 3]AJF40890.1 hypothetical protein SBVP3_00123 [Vibrio phage phi 3]